MGWVALLVIVLLGGVFLLGSLGMIPTFTMFQRLFVLLGSDSATLNKTSILALKMILFQNEVTVDMNTDIDSLVEADFPGYAAITAKESGMPQSVDPATADSLLDFPPQAGSYLWETTGAVSPEQTIYGYALVNAAKDELFFAANLAAPVTLNAINQSVSIPRAFSRMVAGSVQ